MSPIKTQKSDQITVRHELFRTKPFLNRLYRDWYGMLVDTLPPVPGPTLEVGAGGGFLADHCPGLIQTDIQFGADNDLSANAMALPVRSDSLRALVMINMFHHLSDPEAFLHEASRCVKPGGAVAMIEPWITPCSWLIYRWFHHEPCDMRQASWRAPTDARAGFANAALPWIVLCRDREKLAGACPGLLLDSVTLMAPVSYLCAGGVRAWGLPGALYKPCRALERCVKPLYPLTAMFALIRLVRR
jgi:SAM-dependent methyltransferase